MEQAETIRQRHARPLDMLSFFGRSIGELEEPATQAFLEQLPQVEQLYEQMTTQVQDDNFYDQVEAQSLKLQTRVADIMRHLEFATEAHATPLGEAIAYFQAHDGQVGEGAPIRFMSHRARANIISEKGKLRVSLYKALLARHLVKGLKNGLVFVATSHQHKSIDAYLLDDSTWQRQKAPLLQQAGMDSVADWEGVRQRLLTKLDGQARRTGERLESGENEWVEKRRDNTWRLRTPTLGDSDEAPIDLFPQDRIVPIYEVLETVNRSCQFVDEFESTHTGHGPQRPADALFLAGIIGLDGRPLQPDHGSLSQGRQEHLGGLLRNNGS